MPNRSEWKFPMSASELHDLAQKKVAHHRERVSYYEGEQKRLQDEYVASVRDAAEKAATKEAEAAQEWLAQIDMHTHNISGRTANATPMPGRGVQVFGDQDIHADLQRAQGKIQEHVTKIGTYLRWVQLLARSEATLEINIEDAHFFGLGDD
jgi:hypothetical protein